MNDNLDDARPVRIASFRIGELFPSSDPVSCWLTVCAIALNDTVPVNNRIVTALQEDRPIGLRLYDRRLSASHLFEASKFLTESERRFPEIRAFIERMPEAAQASRQRLTTAYAGSDEFAQQLKQLRNHFFHYAELLTVAPDYETLKRAMDAQADLEGDIIDPGQLRGVRNTFADEVSVALSLPGLGDLGEFMAELTATTGALWQFIRADLAQHMSDHQDAYTVRIEPLPPEEQQ